MKNKIEKLLPFLESEDLKELAMDILNGKSDISLTALLPFMDEDDVDEIIMKISDHPEWLKKINVAALLPFASEDALDALLQKNSESIMGSGKVTLSTMMPFLSEETIDKLFLEDAARGKVNSEALPFVSDECLHKLVSEYVKNPNLKININELYPFLDNDDISLLFKTYLKRQDDEDEEDSSTESTPDEAESDEVVNDDDDGVDEDIDDSDVDIDDDEYIDEDADGNDEAATIIITGDKAKIRFGNAKIRLDKENLTPKQRKEIAKALARAQREAKHAQQLLKKYRNHDGD